MCSRRDQCLLSVEARDPFPFRFTDFNFNREDCEDAMQAYLGQADVIPVTQVPKIFMVGLCYSTIFSLGKACSTSSTPLRYL